RWGGDRQPWFVGDGGGSTTAAGRLRGATGSSPRTGSRGIERLRRCTRRGTSAGRGVTTAEGARDRHQFAECVVRVRRGLTVLLLDPLQQLRHELPGL